LTVTTPMPASTGTAKLNAPTTPAAVAILRICECISDPLSQPAPSLGGTDRKLQDDRQKKNFCQDPP
jgi:hypothetical protein